eukprot:4940567-Prymnesium_polylepis.1
MQRAAARAEVARGDETGDGVMGGRNVPAAALAQRGVLPPMLHACESASRHRTAACPGRAAFASPSLLALHDGPPRTGAAPAQ